MPVSLPNGIGTACDRYQAPGGGEMATIPIRGGESFSLYGPRGVVKNLKLVSNIVGRRSCKISPAQVKNRQVPFTEERVEPEN